MEGQLIYALNPLLWREASEVRRVPAFAVVGLPKMLLPAALRHQHVEYLNARRVQTLMHVHGGLGLNTDAGQDESQLVPVEALAAEVEETDPTDGARERWTCSTGDYPPHEQTACQAVKA